MCISSVNPLVSIGMSELEDGEKAFGLRSNDGMLSISCSFSA